MKPPRRTMLTLAVLAICHPESAQALTLEPILNFAAVNQSQWASGQAFVLDESLGKYINPTLQWDVSSYDVFNTSPTKLLLDALKIDIPFLDNGLHTSAGFGTTGKLGFDMGIRATTGHVNISYPVKPTLGLPDQIVAGKTFTLNSNWSLPVPGAANALTNLPITQVASIAGLGYGYLDKGDLLVDQSGQRILQVKPSLNTFFPAVQAWADLALQAQGDVRINVEGKIGAFGIEHSESWTQRVVLPAINKSTELLRVDSQGKISIKTPGLGGLGFDDVLEKSGGVWKSLKDGVEYNQDVNNWLAYDYPNVNPWLHVQGHIPKVDTKGLVQADGRRMVADGQDDLMSVSLDIPHLAGALLDAPLSVTFPSTTPNLKLDLVSGTSGPVASVYQNFTFDPHLVMELRSNIPISRRLADGSWTSFSSQLAVPLGEPVELRTPMGTLKPLPDLKITPVYRLDNTFTNETGVALSIESDMKAITATFPSPVGGDLSLGPLVTVKGRVELGRLPVYKETFSINGFKAIAQADFTLGTIANPQLSDWAPDQWHQMLLGDTDPATGLTILSYRTFNDEPGVTHVLHGTVQQDTVLSIDGHDMKFTFFTVSESDLPGVEESARILCLDCQDLSAYLPTTSAYVLDTHDDPIYFSDLSQVPDEPLFSYDDHPEFLAGLRDVQGTVTPGYAETPVITAVPEPESWLLGLVGGCLLAWRLNWRKGRRESLSNQG
jgi:hypothetical protein